MAGKQSRGVLAENNKLNEKLGRAVAEVEERRRLTEGMERQVEGLRGELSESVPKEEFMRIESNYDDISRQFYGV
eukprot:CAMPEP_0202975258 /NCGR_PEP_ID=MMETSP1396-20130829/67535_1 /ASSEMBLY_ACC=CAM_ASM_000872 /TAXON_ID= /ORGANISM="Pseudokeronopsis sp., Strain Brazil" /LENGTH=74 /DNA_ID=CAMNT_0049710533 /DNA_START=146 /DNA_END=368 /DNA_ORIENTATION=+